MDLTLHVLVSEDHVPRRLLPAFLSGIRKGGATVVQIREKGKSFPETLRYGEAVAFVAEEVGLRVSVNDDPELALALGADILHLGRDDVHPERPPLLGPGSVLGLSARNLDELSWALTLSPAYIGYGPVFSTASKPDATPAVGLESLRETVRRAGAIPIVAIGGISKDNAWSVWETGVKGLAVISAVDPAQDPASQVRALLDERGAPGRSGKA